MTLLTGDKARLADLLFNVGAIRFSEEGFTLKLHEKHPDAPKSPIYVNLRTARHPSKPGPLTDEIMELIGDLFEQISTLKFDVFADIPNAGEPFGDQVDRAYSGTKSRLRLRKIEHDNGTREIAREVNGKFNAGDVCLLVDELITQADSKLEAVDAVESFGLRVEQILVLVDRMQGGREQLKQRGYELVSVFTLHELLSHYVSRELIPVKQARKVLDYVATNRVVVAV